MHTGEGVSATGEGERGGSGAGVSTAGSGSLRLKGYMTEVRVTYDDIMMHRTLVRRFRLFQDLDYVVQALCPREETSMSQRLVVIAIIHTSTPGGVLKRLFGGG
jgi:hypothetical protein